VFPTTTVAALGSVNSGVAPSEHGLLGYTIYLPEFDMVAEMIRWGPLNRRVSFADPEFGRAPESFFWAETMYARLQAAGVKRTFAINPIGFAGTALTRMLHQHATYAGYIATSSMQPMVSRLVAESDETTYVYAYWPTIDTISHIVGPHTPEHSAEVAAFDFQFGRLLERLPGRDDTLVMLTADHGHVDTVPEQGVQFADHPELLKMLRVPPAGERRAVYLHPKPGATLDVAAYARERMRDVAPAMLRDDAVELGLFGPGRLTERAAGRIGDVLLFPRGNLQLVSTIEAVDGNPPRQPVFRGLHGGLTAEEALVPLLAIRL
jgi:predicted AlkP superfamily pyrophosphatase or phosphodiesterase